METIRLTYCQYGNNFRIGDIAAYMIYANYLKKIEHKRLVFDYVNPLHRQLKLDVLFHKIIDQFVDYEYSEMPPHNTPPLWVAIPHLVKQYGNQIIPAPTFEHSLYAGEMLDWENYIIFNPLFDVEYNQPREMNDEFVNLLINRLHFVFKEGLIIITDKPNYIKNTSIKIITSKNLYDLLYIISRCRVFIGGDTGFSHFAGLCRVPCLISIYGQNSYSEKAHQQYGKPWNEMRWNSLPSVDHEKTEHYVCIMRNNQLTTFEMFLIEEQIQKAFQKSQIIRKNMDSRTVLSQGFNSLKQTRYGYMLYNHHDMYVGRSIEQYGEFSEGETLLFKQLIHPHQVVLDIGANIGAHTLFFSQQVGEQGLVLAFEPQRIVYQTLCANIALNAITNVHCYQAALGEQIGQIKVPILDYNQTGNYGGLSLDHQNNGETVPVMTVDNFNLPACHLMKIDVEGMEETVLKGAIKTIEKYRPILYVENDREQKSASLIQFLLNLSYRLYWHLPPLYNPSNYFKNPQNVFGNIVSVNMLCIHRDIPITLDNFREITNPNDSWRVKK